MSSQNIWPWRPAGLTIGSARGLWETETLLVSGAHKISDALGPSTEAVIWKESGSDPPADPGEPSKEAGGHWSSPWGHRHWRQPLWGTHSTTCTMVLAKSHSVILPLPYQPQDPAPTTSLLVPGLGHSQSPWDPAPLNSGKAPAQESPVLLTSKPDLALGPALPTSGRTPAPGKPQPHSLWTEPTHQQASTSSETSWALAGQHKLWDIPDPTASCVRKQPHPPVAQH